VLTRDDPKVQNICEAQGGRDILTRRSPLVVRALCGKPMKKAVRNRILIRLPAILVDVPDDETGRSGKLLRNQGYVEKIPVISRYWFGDDGILTIDTDYDNNQGQERCWFITNDFRVRVSTIRMMNGVYLMTYCSERRYLSDANLSQKSV